MKLALLFALVGVLLILEGAALLLMNKESWHRLREQLSKMSIGQIHTVGIGMAAGGVVLLLLSLSV